MKIFLVLTVIVGALVILVAIAAGAIIVILILCSCINIGNNSIKVIIVT